jgi:hypothetical protein
LIRVLGRSFLVGYVSNDSRFADGTPLRTSYVAEIDEAAGLARTQNTLYELVEKMDEGEALSGELRRLTLAAVMRELGGPKPGTKKWKAAMRAAEDLSMVPSARPTRTLQ